MMDSQPQYPTKVLPQSSSGYTGNGSRTGVSKYEEIMAGRTNSVYAGIPKPNVQSAVSRQIGPTHPNYNSTSAAGYQSKQVGKSHNVDTNEYSNAGAHSEVRDSIQNNRNLLQNLQGQQKRKFNEGATSNSKLTRLHPLSVIVFSL